MTITGYIGIKPEEGDEIVTHSGRACSPYPAISKSSDHIAWLINEAIVEARYVKRSDLQAMLKAGQKKPSQPLVELAEQLLFGGPKSLEEGGDIDCSPSLTASKNDNRDAAPPKARERVRTDSVAPAGNQAQPEPTKVITMQSMAKDPAIAGISATEMFLIDPRLIEFEEGFNVREYDDDETQAYIDGFCASYLGNRYVPPVCVRFDSDTGKILAVEGHCRTQGALRAIAAGKTDLMLRSTLFRGDEKARVATMLNTGNSLGLKPLEMAVGVAKLIELGVSKERIAEVTRMSVEYVKRLLILNTADDPMRELIKAGRISPTEATDVIKAHGASAADHVNALLESVALEGRTKITKRDASGIAPRRKVMVAATSVLSSFGDSISTNTRVELERLKARGEDALRSATIEISAEALSALLDAHAALKADVERQEQLAARRVAEVAQGDLPLEGNESELQSAA